jgi:hypothetical protein
MTQLPSSGCPASLGTLLVALLGAFLVFTTGAAEACSKHVTSGNFVQSAKIAQEGRHLAQVAVTTLKIFKAGHQKGGAPCCAGGCHYCGVGCVNGCCAGGLAAIDVTGSNLVPTEGAASYALPSPRNLASLKPPPDFRPPRFFA